MYLDFDDYYDPSEGELFFDEMKEKFREILREDVNSELSKIGRASCRERV